MERSRDFDKKKLIIAGNYLCKVPDKPIGLAEMFDYKNRMNQITIGYRINELYWHRGIATDTVKLMMDYLCDNMSIQELKAFVMPENVFSEKALIKNGFVKEPDTVQEKNRAACSMCFFRIGNRRSMVFSFSRISICLSSIPLTGIFLSDLIEYVLVKCYNLNNKFELAGV